MTKNKIVFFISFILFFQFLMANNSIFYKNKSIDIGGLKIHILKNNRIDFIHAELIIMYKTKNTDSVIPFITAKTIFTKSYKSRTPVSKILRTLGNDYNFSFMGDYVLFRINFLKKDLPKFVKFLSILFKTNKISAKDLKYEKKIIIKNYKKNRDFQIKMGTFLAYKYLFKNKILGNNFFIKRHVNKVNINKLLIHYKGTYTPTNMQLYLTGKIHTARTIGYISKSLRGIVKSYKYKEIKETNKLDITPMPIILNIPGLVNPTILFFKIINGKIENDYISSVILNDIMFRQYPFNIIKENKKYNVKKRFVAVTKILKHKGIIVIRNAFSLNYQSVKQFLFLLNSDVVKIKSSFLSRRNYKIALNYYYGKLKVETKNYNSVLKRNLSTLLFKTNNYQVYENKNILYKINYELNRARQELIKSKKALSKNEVIVIIGDFDKIMKFYPEIGGEIVDTE